MKLRQLLSWRFSLIFFHRWLGILIGLMFVIWSVSGIVLMYYGIPHITAGERLDRLPVLNLGTATLTPQEALDKVGGTPFRLRISMLEGRPVYRINTGTVFGNWNLVFADNGQVVHGFDQDSAMYLMFGNYPEQAQDMYYENYLRAPDMFTHSPALQNHFPLHRVHMGNLGGTRYYVSEKSGEVVMKTTFTSRILGFMGYNLHTLFFWRQAGWWGSLLLWLSWGGLLITVLGLVLGIWRFSRKPVYIKRDVAYRTPYTGWWKWHHYAGLIFGVFMLTWMISGLVSLAVIPGVVESPYTPAQLQAGARTLQGFGPPVDYAPLSLDGMRRAVDEIGQEFPVKELELVYYNGTPYYLAYRSPTPEELENWKAGSAMEFMAQNLPQEHRFIAASGTQAQPFSEFSEGELLRAAATAMPGLPYTELSWLREHDSYYYEPLKAFDLGLPRAVHSFPVLRLKYDDPQQTWLYLTPTHGQLLKAETTDRRNRWGYYALHGFDFGLLFDRRPLWDIVVVILLLGCVVMSTTTLVPMYDRLKRHALRLARLFHPES